MLDVKDITLSINGKTLIENLSFTLQKDDKMAIIGEEGNGKSSFLKALMGKLDYGMIAGSINHKGNKIGYLEQFINKQEETLQVKEYLFKNEDEYYEKINEYYKYLNEIDIKDYVLEPIKLENLSGGEKVKIGLLKILLEEPDILFLDEPTNDLDLETLNWLEKFIIKSKKPIIYISHDEIMLEKTANKIMHIENIDRKSIPRHTIKKIGYKDYVCERLHLINRQEQISKKEKYEHQKQTQKMNQIMNKVEHRQNTISRSEPHQAAMLKKKMSSIKSMEKRLEKSVPTEMPDYEEGINIFFDNTRVPNSKKIITLEKIDLKINDLTLSSNINVEIIGPKKIVIIGKNGVGKSTLLKYIYNNLREKKDIKVGYMPQNYEDVLHNYKDPISFLTNSTEKEEIKIACNYLGNMKFTSEEMLGNISDLSGGSKAKLLLLKLIIDKYNVLILDEPTRNISPLSNPVIRKALKKFNGAIISVSHDRKFIEEVIDDIYELTEQGLTVKN
jgi:ATPase components of ABC transporters with duplicated ATPase domains